MKQKQLSLVTNFMDIKMLFYVAGPLSNGTGVCLEENVVKAVEVAEQLYERGHYAFVPHLTMYQHEIIQQIRPGYVPEYNRWLDYDIEILWRCDALFYIGSSKGADIEKAAAQDKEIPIYTNMDDVPVVKRRNNGD